MKLIGKALLERYKIIDRIGQGGFGKTYLAIDLALPNQPKCVLKHLSPQNDSPQVFKVAKRLFETEAESLYNLGKHDSIPSLYAHFPEEGQFYLVQEYIDGNDLSREIVPEKKFSESETIELIKNILEVLEIVHQNNIIHRDLKPSNIMRRKKDGKIVLIDFGTVKQFSTLNIDNEKTSFTTIGVGSPGYMPSEQSQGKPKLASDIYAVGIIAIRALTGTIPAQFREDNITGEIIWRDRAKVSKKLANIIDKMVRFDYRQRYQNATEALNSLKALINKKNPAYKTTVIKDSETISDTNITKIPSKKIAIASCSIAILGILLGAFSFINKPVVEQPQKLVYFSKLERYLNNREWQKADRETDRLMLKIARKKYALDSIAIKNFDCKLLIKINRLWIDNSNARYGFSPRAEVYYLDTGNISGKYDREKYQEFGNSVGWRSYGHWKNYSKLSWNSPPFAHLPTPGIKQNNNESLRISEHWQLLDRSAECGI